MEENWKAIENFSDYQVSDLGRVRSKRKTGSWVVMTGGLTRNGMFYRRYTMVDDDGVKCLRNGHRLVLCTFKPRSDDSGPMVLHRDGNGQNNCLSNLYWGDAAQNAEDKLAHGWSAQGELNPNRRLNEKQVEDIRQKYSTGCVRQVDIGEYYGITQTQVSRIVRNESWVA